MKKSKTNYKASSLDKKSSTVSGIVTNKKGKPIQGAMVLNGTSIGVITNAKGVYVIKAKKGDKLVYSFKEMNSQEIEVKGNKTINIKLSKKKI